MNIITLILIILSFVLICIILAAIAGAMMYLMQTMHKELQLMTGMLKLLTPKFELKYKECLTLLAQMTKTTFDHVIAMEIMPELGTSDNNNIKFGIQKDQTYSLIINKTVLQTIESIDSYFANNLKNYFTQEEMVNYMTSYIMRMLNKFIAEHALAIKRTGSNNITALNYATGMGPSKVSKKPIARKRTPVRK